MYKYLVGKGFSILNKGVRTLRDRAFLSLFLHDGDKTYYYFLFPLSAGGAEMPPFDTLVFYLITCGKISFMSFEEYQAKLKDTNMANYTATHKVGKGVLEIMGLTLFTELANMKYQEEGVPT